MKKIFLLAASCAIACSSYSQTIVADWDFNAGNANDVSGNGNNGTLFGGVTTAAGQLGVPNTAMQFDGSTGYISVTSDTSLDLTSWTLMANVKFNGFYSGSCQENRIIDRATASDGSLDHYCLAVGDNFYDNSCSIFTPTHEVLHGGVAGTIPIGLTSTNYVTTGTWYCLTATYAGDTLKTYINGVLEDALYVANAYSYPSSADLYLGRHINAGFPYWFNGVMDRVTLWDSALSVTQINTECGRDNIAPCLINDIQFCSSLSTPFAYMFTALTTPTTGYISWDFGDATSPVIALATQSVSHTYAFGGNYNICATKLDTNQLKCGTAKCFTMCLDRNSGAKPSAPRRIGTINSIKNESLIEPYPNPANSVINVPVTAVSAKATVTIIDANGKLLLTKSVDNRQKNGIIQCPISQLFPGNYLIQIKDDQGTRVKPFTKL